MVYNNQLTGILPGRQSSLPLCPLAIILSPELGLNDILALSQQLRSTVGPAP